MFSLNGVFVPLNSTIRKFFVCAVEQWQPAFPYRVLYGLFSLWLAFL
jgi:hypothetical protein